MRYNIIGWDIAAKNKPELCMDTWTNTLCDAEDVLIRNSKTTSRGIIIDFKPKIPEIIQELKGKTLDGKRIYNSINKSLLK